MGLVVLGQYAATAATSIGIQDTLSPAVDSSAEVGLEQASASGSLADYVMLRRDASLDDYRQALGRATTLLADLRTATADFPELSALVAEATAAQRAWTLNPLST